MLRIVLSRAVVGGLTAPVSSGAAVAAIFALSCAAADRPEVGQWDRFETSVRNARTYADPYHDVTLHVFYTRPDKVMPQSRGGAGCLVG